MSQVGDLVAVAKVTESDLVMWSQVGGLGAGGKGHRWVTLWQWQRSQVGGLAVGGGRGKGHRG